MPDELFRLSDVPIFETGTWNGDVYNEADLDAIVSAYGQVGFKPPLKLGHDESQPFAKSDGMPAIGWVENLKRNGKRLLADFVNIPRVVADAVKRKAYDRVSAEIYWDYQETQKRFPRVLKAVALLGAEIPAVTSLAALQTLYDARQRPFKRYDMMPQMPSLTETGPSLAMPVSPKLAKADVKYQKADAADAERCGACRFFLGPSDPTGAQNWLGSCAIVDGEVASGMVCGQFHVREAFAEYAKPFPKEGNQLAEKDDADAAKANAAGLTVEEMDGQYCVMVRGEKQRCFPTPEEADAYVQSLSRTSDPKPISDEAGSAGQDGEGEEAAGDEDELEPDEGAQALDQILNDAVGSLLGDLAEEALTRVKDKITEAFGTAGNEGGAEGGEEDAANDTASDGDMTPAADKGAAPTKEKKKLPPWLKHAMREADFIKSYVIQRRGSGFVLVSRKTGKVLGRHPRRADAAAQERAIQANKRGYVRADGTVEYRFTLDEVSKWCAPCAKAMRFKNLKLLKISYDPTTKTYAGFSQGMCDKFGEPSGFRTRCMGAMAGQVDDEGAFCNALKAHCHGDVAKESTQQVARSAADAQVAKAAEERTAMDEKEKQDLMDRLAKAEAFAAEQKARAEQVETEAKTYSARATEAEAKLAEQAEAARAAGNKAWVEGLASGTAPKILPAERPWVEYVLNVLTAPAGTQVKTYSHEGKDFAPADAFKKLYEQREGFAAELFTERTVGGASERASRATPASGVEARAQAHELAKQYIANAAKNGGTKVDYGTAYRAVLSEHPDLKSVLYGPRPEGAMKQAEGAMERARLTGEGK